MSSLFKLGSHTLIYGGSRFLSKGLGFLLLPIYTRFLTSEDYGALSLLLVTSGIVATAAQLGIHSALFREIIYKKSNRAKAESTAFWSLLFVGTLVFWSLILFAKPLALVIFGRSGYASLLQLVFATGWFELSSLLFLTTLRIRDRPGWYGGLTLARFLVEIGLNIYLIVYLGRGLEGLILAGFFTSALFGTLYLGVFLYRKPGAPNRVMLRRLLTYGLPLVPANLAGMVLTSSDRYFLQHFSGPEQVGLYSVGYMLGQITAMAVQAVHLAWPSHMFRVAQLPDGAERLAQTLTWYVLTMGALVLGSAVLAPELLVLMTTPEYHIAAGVVPLIALGNLFYGMRFITNSGLSTRNKMGPIPLIIAGAALVNLLLNAWWIPKHGMMGAAWATLVAYFLLFLTHLLINLKVWFIPYEVGRLLWLFLSGMLWFYVATLFEIHEWWLSMLVKLLWLVCWPLHFLLFGFLRKDERVVLQQRFGRE